MGDSIEPYPPEAIVRFYKVPVLQLCDSLAVPPAKLVRRELR